MQVASAVPDARHGTTDNRNDHVIPPGRDFEPLILTLPLRRTDAPKIISLLIDPSVNQFTLGRVCSR